MTITYYRFAFAAAISGFIFLNSCADNVPNEGRESRDDSSTQSSGEPTRPQAQVAPTETADTNREFEPIDPATGTMSLVATGAHPGSWTFKDVNGSINERAGGGQTKVVLQLEAHNDPVHFKVRLATASGEFEPGIYSIGGEDRGVDATYENAGIFYKPLGRSKGTVSLTSLQDNRAKGVFDLTLETLEETARLSQVKGTFDIRMQR